MKKVCLIVFAVVFCFAVSNDLIAQTKKKTTKKTTAKQGAFDPFGGAVNSSQQSKQSKSNTKQQDSNFDPFGSNANQTATNNATSAVQDTTKKKGSQQAPYEFIASKGNALTDSTKASLRNDNGVDESYIKEQTPLAYDHIREDDAVFKQRIWSVIDTREKSNLLFTNPRVEDNGSQLFFAIVYKAIADGTITAFKDDRFTQPISKDKFITEFGGGGLDTQAQYNIDNPDKVDKYIVRPIELNTDSIYQFQIKEDVIFEKAHSVLVRRIIGIAPMWPAEIKGKFIPGSKPYPHFWVYFPDLRPILVKYRVFNPRNYGANMNWDDIFQQHMYSSFIVKTTSNNYKDKSLAELVKDPLFQLLEGDKIKEKIFNYEQDLWAY